jgi:hypothetical protein
MNGDAIAGRRSFVTDEIEPAVSSSGSTIK